MIDNFLNQKFFTPTSRDIVYIEKLDSDYILSNRNGYLANIEKITSKGFRWYAFFLGKQVKGSFTFAEIEKNLVPVIDKEPKLILSTNTTTKP